MKPDDLTGLDCGQRILLYGRCAQLLGEVVRPGGRPAAIGLYESVMPSAGVCRSERLPV
ncbi:hypothetical protein ACWC2K_31835 [Streptomyces chattanoogensis]